MQIALLSASARIGDAIGNQVAEKAAFFHDRGAEVRIYLEDLRHIHPALKGSAHQASATALENDDWDFLRTCDIVIAEFGHAYQLLNILPSLTGEKPRILFDYHGVTPPELWGSHNRQGLEKALEQRGLVWCADAALTHSQFTRQELRDATRFPEDRIATLGHPVDLQLFRPGPPRRSLRQRLRLGPARLLLFVGRLAPNKRLPVLIDVLARLSDRVAPVHLAVVGDDSDVYQEEAAHCRELAAILGVGARLHLLGRLGEDDLVDAYRSADIFVMPSLHEGFCIPAIEAMATGLPVVVARAGALPETVADAGLTFRPDDARELANQISTILESKGVEGASLGDRLQEAGLARASQFDRTAWRARFAEMIGDLLDRPQRPHRQHVTVVPGMKTLSLPEGTRAAVLPVRIRNDGSHAIASEGPGRMVLRTWVFPENVRMPPSADASGFELPDDQTETGLPALLQPGQTVATIVELSLPPFPGTYRVAVHAAFSKESTIRDRTEVDEPQPNANLPLLKLRVESQRRSARARQRSMAAVQQLLVEARRSQRLPVGYTDVTEGRFASIKRWIKKKLLGNFQRAYVDVLSTRQSAFNQRVIAVLAELVTNLDARIDSIGQTPAVSKQLEEAQGRIKRLERLLERQLQTAHADSPSPPASSS